MLRALICLCLISLLPSCALAPPTLGSYGCAITHYGERWVKANAAKAQWTGSCEDGYASGTGTMTLTTASGATETYEGHMRRGNFDSNIYNKTPDVYRDGRYEFRGTFYSGRLYKGSVRDQDRLLFEGELSSGSYKKGRLHLPSGNVIDGDFIESAPSFSSDGAGVKRATVLDADGRVLHWIDSEKVIRDEAQWQQAGVLAAAREAEEARLYERRVALDGELSQISKALFDQRQYTEVGTARDALAYYSEGVQIEQTFIALLDQMRADCAEPCAFTGVLQKRRQEAFDYMKHCEAEARENLQEIEEGQQMAETIARLEQAVAESGAVSAGTMDLYAQTKARNEAIGAALNRLAGNGGPSGFAQNLADAFLIVRETRASLQPASGLRYDIDRAKSSKGATVYRFYDLGCVSVKPTGKTFQGDIEKIAQLDCPVEAQFFYQEQYGSRHSSVDAYEFSLISRPEQPRGARLSGYAKAMPITRLKSVSCPSKKVIEATIKGHCSQDPIFVTEPFAYCECNVYAPVGTAN